MGGISSLSEVMRPGMGKGSTAPKPSSTAWKFFSKTLLPRLP
jgi:hypothetical protein